MEFLSIEDYWVNLGELATYYRFVKSDTILWLSSTEDNTVILLGEQLDYVESMFQEWLQAQQI